MAEKNAASALQSSTESRRWRRDRFDLHDHGSPRFEAMVVADGGARIFEDQVKNGSSS
jgi:hypothetical protein